MTLELVTIHTGQCGNQVGFEFWKRICAEHGIAQDGSCEDFKDDSRNVFFYQDDRNHYIPRALLIDLEPRVINSISQSDYKDLFNPDNKLVNTSGGGGAANNWARGYSHGEAISERFLEALDRELENSECPEGFMLFHSAAGGTGSGLGSYLAQSLSDIYPKKIIQAYSIFPNTSETSDVVVQPYNTILSLSAISQTADSMVIFDNSALNRIAHDRPSTIGSEFDQINQLISSSICASTSTLRYPGASSTSFMDILAPLVTVPRCNLLAASYIPLPEINPLHKSRRKFTLLDIMKKFLLPKNIMVSVNDSVGKYMSILNIIQGNVDSDDIHKSLMKLREKNVMPFVPWGPVNPRVVVSPSRSNNSEELSGVMLANFTGIKSLLKRLGYDFDSLYRRNAFISSYSEIMPSSQCVSIFQEARENLQDIIDEYSAVEKSDYFRTLCG